MTTPQLLWFVLAGFLLGFTTSTLWEWFHFRRERLKLTDRRVRELEAKLQEQEQTLAALPVSERLLSAEADPNWNQPAYRSPGVFLETETPKSDRPLRTEESARTPVTAAANAPAKPTVAPRVFDAVADSGPTAGRSESSPADALRARRHEPARSRQEALAALRRNSEAANRRQGNPPAEARVEDMNNGGRSDGVNPNPDATPNATPANGRMTAGAVSSTAATSQDASARRQWANDPGLTQRSRDYPDDLSKIKGIGDVYKVRLYRAGIYTWHQIAEADAETLRRATSAYPSSNVEEWPVQARQLAAKHGRSGAVYSGSLPDDLTKILGIGPVGAQALYRVGICTYEQLAVTAPEFLADLFPIAVAGDQPDFDQWIVQATHLADSKYQPN